jgi:hypothetical protein
MASAVVFSHGWPPSADAWDQQMLFLLTQNPETGPAGTGVL